jgi:hypothetical protein
MTKISRTTASFLFRLALLMLAGSFSAEAAGPRYGAGWMPALEDDDDCLSVEAPFGISAFWETCRPEGRFEYVGGTFRGRVDLGQCPFLRGVTSGGSYTLLVYTQILPIPLPCGCGTPGCCQLPPESVVFATRITSTKGSTLYFRATIPTTIAPERPPRTLEHAQIEIVRVEVRATGRCKRQHVIDLEDGEARIIDTGPALAVAGFGRLPATRRSGWSHRQSR